ncbi:hypothetical protein F1880_010268 [Penicillium rolfsii]|nr:hypothetical protein F1880_010268 [Penicillium rolfsii]
MQSDPSWLLTKTTVTRPRVTVMPLQIAETLLYIGRAASAHAGHSSHVAGITYGREVTERAGTTAQRREFFRLSSTDWHRFLGFPDVESGLGQLLGWRPSPFDQEAQQLQHQRGHRLMQVNAVERPCFPQLLPFPGPFSQCARVGVLPEIQYV